MSEILGIEAPTVYRGVAPPPITGLSLAYTIDAAEAPPGRSRRDYEILGDRTLWHQAGSES